MAPKYVVYLCVDYGTATISVGYCLMKNDQKIDEKLVRPVRFFNNCYTPPAIIALKADYSGYELAEHANSGDVRAEDVIEYAKLGLYGEDGGFMRRAKERVQSQLVAYELTLQDLLHLHLHAILSDTRVFVLNQESVIDDDMSADNLGMRVRLSVPRMWSPDARRIMLIALRQIDLPIEVAGLVSEPQACVAYYLRDLVISAASRGEQIKAGHCILVVGNGGGTGGRVTFKAMENLTKDSRLEAVEQEAGALSGSARINYALYEHLQQHNYGRLSEGGLNGFLKRMARNKRTFERECLQQIELMKKDFPDAQRPVVQQAFDHVLVDIFNMMDNQTKKHQPKIILMTGGLCNNSYIIDKITTRYQAPGVKIVQLHESVGRDPMPVAIGGLLRYERIDSQKLPSRYSFALLQDEFFDHTDHPDACFWRGSRRMQNPDIVMPSIHDNETPIVTDRLYIFLRKGNKAPIEPQNVTHEQIYYVGVDEPVLSATLVYLDGDGFADHHAARTADGSYKDGVTEWAHIKKELDKHALARAGFPITENARGEREFCITARLVMKYDPDQELKVGWKLTQPEGLRLVWQDEEPVWLADASDFVPEPDRIEIG